MTAETFVAILCVAVSVVVAKIGIFIIEEEDDVVNKSLASILLPLAAGFFIMAFLLHRYQDFDAPIIDLVKQEYNNTKPITMAGCEHTVNDSINIVHDPDLVPCDEAINRGGKLMDKGQWIILLDNPGHETEVLYERNQ